VVNFFPLFLKFSPFVSMKPCLHYFVLRLASDVAGSKLFFGRVQNLENVLREGICVRALGALQQDLNVAQLAKVKVALLLEPFDLHNHAEKQRHT
jgi:hypothetical protein